MDRPTELPVPATQTHVSFWVIPRLSFKLISRSTTFNVGNKDYVSSFYISRALNFSLLMFQVFLRGVEMWLVHHIIIINMATTYMSVHYIRRTVSNALHEASLILNNLIRRYYCNLPVADETEAQISEVTCLSSHK